MNESLSKSKQAERVVDAEVEASPHWNEDANSAAAVKTRSGRLVVGAEAHTIRMMTRTPPLVSKLRATCNRGDDTNAAAASKGKADRTEVVSRSQENKNEETKEGDDWSRRLV